MDLAELNRLLGIDETDAVDARAKRLVEADGRLLDDLIAMRKRKRLSQEDVATRMEISQSAVAKIEAGDRDPRLSTLRRYALAVGALVGHVVDDDEVPLLKVPGDLGSHVDVLWEPPVRRVEAGRPRKGAGV